MISQRIIFEGLICWAILVLVDVVGGFGLTGGEPMDGLNFFDYEMPAFFGPEDDLVSESDF